MKNALISFIIFGNLAIFSFHPTSVNAATAAQSQEDFINQYLQQKQQQQAAQEQANQQAQQVQDEKTKQTAAELQQTLNKVYGVSKLAFFILFITVVFLWLTMALLIVALIKYLRSTKKSSIRSGMPLDT